MQRRVEGANGHGQAVHFAEDADEVFALQRLHLGQGGSPFFDVFGNDHLADGADPVAFKEHVLCAAKADPLGAELPRHLRVVWAVAVRAHANLAKGVCPAHQGGEVRVQRRLHGLHAAQEHLAGRAVHGKQFALADGCFVDGELLRGVVDPQIAGPGDARLAHAARYHGGVRCHAAAGREHRLRGDHAVEVFGRRLDAHQDHFFAVHRHGRRLVGVEYGLAAGGAWRGREPARQEVCGGPRLGVQGGVEELLDLGRLYAPDRGFAGDDAFVHQVHGYLHGSSPAALAGPCLQHIERAALDRELHILDILVVRLQLAGDRIELGVDGGHLRLHLGDWAGRAHPGDHVFALGIDQVFAVERVFAGRRVAAEGHTGGTVVAHVAEDHGLHIDRRAKVVADFIEPPVVHRAPPVP